MKLKELVSSLSAYQAYPSLLDSEVGGLRNNSKLVKKGDVFIALRGTLGDGHDFIFEAVGNGAVAVVLENKQAIPEASPAGITYIIVDDTRLALSALAARYYADPSLRLKVVGVTGTNAKTTITYLLEAILKENGASPGVIGTVNYRFQKQVIPSTNTTPGPLELQALLARMVSAGCDYALMEVSSHALNQRRTDDIRFASAIFSNLTQDHLDYHKTMQDYFQAKARLFIGLLKQGTAIINNDDEYALKLKKLTPARIVTYGIDNPADVMARDISFSVSKTEFTIVFGNAKLGITSPLIGRYNVYNLLAGFAWGLSAGIDAGILESALEQFSYVPGRLERFESSRGFSVFVDYAHTQDALSNVIKALRLLTPGRIIVVFGCGGERDKSKRPKMGRVVCELADYAVITNDNPRFEDPEAIIQDIRSGITKDNYSVIPDRRQAIEKTFSLARAGDIVLVAGKGHEPYQITGKEVVKFDDREVVRECLGLTNYCPPQAAG